jgi:hypothetical protein
MARTTTAKRTPKAWTFLVYLAGDNNLDPEGVQDIAEMKKVGSTDAVNVVAQFDRPSGATRYFLRRGTTAKADALKSLGELNTGDPRALVDFVTWAAAAYPAERYALVLWNHGQGWDDTDIFAGERAGGRLVRPKRVRRAFFRSSVVQAARLTRRPSSEAKAILIDDGSKDFLDNVETKQALGKIRKILRGNLDLLGMDACLMSMAEVGYQCRQAVSYTVGSEETEPGGGWPYDRILKRLTANPSLTAEALGQVVVDEYLESYRGSGDAVTQSVCSLAAAKPLAAAVKALGSALRGALADDGVRLALVDARNRVRDFEVRENVDLVDLCVRLQASPQMPADVKAAAIDVVAAARGGAASTGGYVVQSGYVGDAMKGSSGVAIYFPTLAVSPLYARLDWAAATGWGEFLEAYVASTRSR